MKKCIICGKEFEPYYTMKNRQITCGSKECMRMRNKKQNKIYYSIEENNNRRKLHQRMQKSNAICRICGRKIERGNDIQHRASNSTMHDGCVVADAIRTLQKGEKLNSTQIQRLYQRGYTITELREEMKEWPINA